MLLPMLLQGQTAIVTGASRGMGCDVARLLARHGARLVIVGRNRAALDKLAAELREAGYSAHSVTADLRDEASVIALMKSALGLLGGRIDILANAHGVTGPPPGPVWQWDADDFRETMDGNVKSCFLTMKHVMPTMLPQRAGRIVNVGGTYGHKGARDRALYGTSKWALRGLTRSAAIEAGQHGITVNLVAPGAVEGPRLVEQLDEEARLTGQAVSALRAGFTTRAALGRVCTGMDIANAVLFLVCEMGRNITGQEIIVDGGTVV